MNVVTLDCAGERLQACPDGALWWPARRLLCLADLHLGKSERIARRGNRLLPPYECADTLDRLDAALATHAPDTVICLGDSFDDLAAVDGLAAAHRDRLARMMERRRWIWIAGNHDPGPPGLAGAHLAEFRAGPLTFRHIAVEEGGIGEISGHYHPKARLTAGGAGFRRPCFLTDGNRLILPAYGTYTGGLDCRAPVLARLMGPGAMAILTGPTPARIPLHRPARVRA